MRKRDYCVVYRTGTRDDFAWHRDGPYSIGDARLKTLVMVSQGELAYCVDYAQSLRLGLPETYAAGDILQA